MSGTAYDEGAIGKWVVLPWAVSDNEEQPFVGQIQQMKRSEVVSGVRGRTSRKVRVEHLVVFHDGDKRWYDLKEEEDSGRLTWVPKMARAEPPAATRRNAKEKTSKKKKSTQVSAKARAEDSLPQWIKDMHSWLLQKDKPMRPVGARRIIDQVMKLASGNGIGYQHWPEDVIFYEGVTIDIDSDFERMLSEAKEYHETYGMDKGRGWLLTMPVSKLLQFKKSRGLPSLNTTARASQSPGPSSLRKPQTSTKSRVSSAKQSEARKREAMAANACVRDTNGSFMSSDLTLTTAESDDDSRPATVASHPTIQADITQRDPTHQQDQPAKAVMEDQRQTRSRARKYDAIKSETDSPGESLPSDHCARVAATTKGSREAMQLQSRARYVCQQQERPASQNRGGTGNVTSSVRTRSAIAAALGIAPASSAGGRRQKGHQESEDVCMSSEARNSVKAAPEGDLVPWLQEMHNWLLASNLTEQTAKQVISQVRKLAAGEGLTYKHWPSGIVFYQGVSVGLHFDFERVLADAKDFEERHGKDRGGWTLRYPLGKLAKFQEYKSIQAI